MAGHRRQNISAMERGAHWMPPIAWLSQANYKRRLARQRCQFGPAAVVRDQQSMPGHLNVEECPLGTHARIDHDDVECVVGKVWDRTGKEKFCIGKILRRYLM